MVWQYFPVRDAKSHCNMVVTTLTYLGILDCAGLITSHATVSPLFLLLILKPQHPHFCYKTMCTKEANMRTFEDIWYMETGCL
jgi:hypothetical protein